MRQKFIIALIVIAAVAGWWYWEHNPNLKSSIEQYVATGDFLTLEGRFTAEQLMDKYRGELLKDENHTFQEPTLKFYPYLLIDAKYSSNDRKTKEGFILFGQCDGEMVLDTENWDTTHGFEDAINAGATRTDFRVMHALAKHNGSLTRDELLEELHVEKETLDPWVDSALKKHLIVANGSELSLHFQNPKILVTPETRFKTAIVTKQQKNMQRIPKKYSASQIEKITQAAFGPGFTIRKINEIYLPIYSLSVLNPDGTIFTTYWNALNGKRLALTPHHLN